MSLIYFHRFLIFCAICFSLFLAWKSYDSWRTEQATTDIILAVLALVVAVGLGFYLRTVKGPEERRKAREEKAQRQSS